MILLSHQIFQEVEAGNITIDPFNVNNVNPNSYDLTLAKEVSVVSDCVLDLAKPVNLLRYRIPEEGMLLVPNKLYLMRTQERTATNKYVPCIEGRSSIGRMGINIHATAGFGDIGFDGTWTLEVSVIHPIKVYAGVRVCQIYFMTADYEHAQHKYHGKYQEQHYPEPSRIWKEKEEWGLK